LLVQLLLTQHFFADAATHILRRSGFHQTSHSNGALHGDFKPTFRCARLQQSGRGQTELSLRLRQ